MNQIPETNDRVQLIFTSDPHTLLNTGSKGTVKRVRSAFGAMEITVDWDSGSKLTLINGEDRWRVLS